MAMLECPGCKHIVDESTKRCANCGYEVKKYFKQLAKDAKKSGRSVGENTIKLGSVYDSQTEASHLEAQLEFLRKPSAVAPEAPAQKAAPVSAPVAETYASPASPAPTAAPSYASPAPAQAAPSYSAPAPAAAAPVSPAPAAPQSSNPFMAANPVGGIGGSMFESPSLAQSAPAPAAPAPTPAAPTPAPSVASPSPAPQAAVLPTSSNIPASGPSSQATVLPMSGSSGSGAATLPVGGGSSQSFFVPGNDSNTSLPAPSQAAPERKPIAPNQPSMFQKPVYQDEPETPLVTSTPKPSLGKFAGGGSASKGLFESEALNQAHANGQFVESSATNATLEDARRAEEKKREEQESYNPYNRKAANNMTLADIPKFQQSASAKNPVAANPLLQGGGFGVGTGAANIQRTSMVEKKEEEVIEGIFDSPLLNQRAKQIADGEFVPTNVASNASLDALEKKRQESVNYASFKKQSMVGKNFMTQIPENLVGKQQTEQAQLSNIDHPVNPFLADRNKPADELGIYGDRPRQ